MKRHKHHLYIVVVQNYKLLSIEIKLQFVNNAHIVETLLRASASAHALCGRVPDLHLMLQHHAHVGARNIHSPEH